MLLVARNADWTLSDKDFKFGKTVTFEDGRIHLNKNGQVGNITSGTITNGKDALILVETDYALNGNFTNEGNIHFVSEPNSPEDDTKKNLTINGNYSGNGAIKMRVNVEKSPITNDKVIISETATGNTKIELANGPVGLKVRTREKATLVEAKAEGSNKNAFSLEKSSFGPYRYLLSTVNENGKIKWVLEQRFIGGGVGNIVSALSNSQQLFAHTYYDRTGAAKNDQGVWVRLGHQRKESQIGSSDSTITSNSTLSHLQIGYDIGSFAFKNGQLSYGAYVNYGTDNTKTQFIGESEKNRSKLKGYGLGLYSSYVKDNWYLDGWLSYNKFSNKLFTEEGINKYDMKALQASAELGYQYNIPVGSQQLAIKPQWQLIYTYIPNFDVAGFDGLKAENRHYLTSRLGVRLNLETAYQFKPFVELNWIYNMKDTAINLEDEKFKLEGNRHLKEVKVGFERLGLAKNAYLWGQVLGRFGTDKYREYAVQAGISYQF
ncbi:hypothetical protein B0186_01970 [Canicola haemoglobinophilus]|uniref:Autotransporter protein Las n=1 Tax=Canicola haemoglobinophilus TaxID=733 RepID=A0A1V4B3C8_9PAST|nr:autotransporter outer membrane beta-barrel domain-containing protein [Canicola haemoglobinophilus]OOS01838.1 hypothetical protein B0186_01970 [Canicola haemoglobinophilus]STO60736.1 Autotransporter protein Las [Canicola haemoglobinophilus]